MKQNYDKTKVLLIYPQIPNTFWSFCYALKFVRKKASFPPLGLLTVAALLPEEWEKKLVDMNVVKLVDSDLAWADYVFISGMIVQRDAIKKVLERCRHFNCKIVAGGPIFTSCPNDFIKDVDHLVLNEGEVTIPLFLADLKKGGAEKIYTSEQKPEITQTPIPLWHLINFKDYATMSIQYSRGCPFDCEFCDITIMNGRVPRTKTKEQLLREVDALYKSGWRGGVFIVDDNFIGNKKDVKAIMPSLIAWMHKRRYPFAFLTEASVNLADDPELMQMMVDAGFNKVFVGLETPIAESLAECNKFLNSKKDLAASVKAIQNAGLEVMAGFIVGFDSDPLSVFERQIEFIQKIGVVTAMVGLLGALPGTKLHKRLKTQGRLLENWSGNNTDCSMNFVPKMDLVKLKEGYKKIVTTIYSPAKYYERVITFIKEFKPKRSVFKYRLSKDQLLAFLRSLWSLGVVWKFRRFYWKLLLVSLFRYPRAFPQAVIFAIYGYHFQKLSEELT
ncbi:MAG: DUF4070 domain-containing protein [Candidatus Omnitrophica bacterium]|nr:DUF4070 domain-containing protein [Candidatus Omnitrophota bacterium]MDD5351617.1 DUF4070 domain-containing protein [Candidatus Omnitrophota bacterium]MDD5550827.1 DUF4070 domain-containing protein [Candidatus Omnitrophota bacterium]